MRGYVLIYRTTPRNPWRICTTLFDSSHAAFKYALSCLTDKGKRAGDDAKLYYVREIV